MLTVPIAAEGVKTFGYGHYIIKSKQKPLKLSQA